MNWLLFPIPLYIAYYTFRYSMVVWKDGHRVGATAAGFLGLLNALLPIVYWLT